MNETGNSRNKNACLMVTVKYQISELNESLKFLLIFYLQKRSPEATHEGARDRKMLPVRVLSQDVHDVGSSDVTHGVTQEVE